ncbi:MAG: glycosyltransferase [Deltaproteobacteria bacterium]|nr:glycosyltransferase [Deltaproteobacteria bacterium]
MKQALVIFAKQPVPGRVKTRLSPPLSPSDAARLYLCMLSDTIEAVASLNHVERFLFFEPSDGAEDFFRDAWPDLTVVPQQGGGLGERLENAFARLFSAGFDAVAAIGTDSPDLPAEYVEDAFRILEERRADVVFGPVEDGGYCLVAMGRLHPELFRDIPWSTGMVLERSEAAAVSLGLGTARIPAWHDIDTGRDLERLLREGNPDEAPRTRRFLRQLVS